MKWLRRLFGVRPAPKLRPCFPILAFIKKHDPEWWAANKHRPASTASEWPGFEKYKGMQYDEETLELMQ